MRIQGRAKAAFRLHSTAKRRFRHIKSRRIRTLKICFGVLFIQRAKEFAVKRAGVTFVFIFACRIKGGKKVVVEYPPKHGERLYVVFSIRMIPLFCEYF